MKISARFYKTAAILSVAGLALAGCIDDYDPEDTAPPGDGETQSGSATIGVFNGWDEGIAVSELQPHVLEQEGYDVSLEQAGPEPAVSGVTSGDYDFLMAAWLPATHEDYIAAELLTLRMPDM